MKKVAYWNAGIVLLACAELSLAGTIYVGPEESLQAAIDSARNGDRIEVGPGTYNERIAFNGKAVRLTSRGGAQVTTLNGGGAGSVVRCVSGEGVDTVLEGITITGGKASNGGGMYNVNSSPTVIGCVFVNNIADSRGGGMYNKNAQPSVSHCTFSENLAVADDGGGMTNDNSSPTVSYCTFRMNSAKDGGGGMHNRSQSHPCVASCTFDRNTAEDGGAMQNFSDSCPTISHCTFLGNTGAHGNGGAIDNTYDSHATITGCTFQENIARFGGAILSGWGSRPVIANCAFLENAAEWGGGLYYTDIPTAKITNCTLSENMAEHNGGGIYNNDCSLTVTNSILWRNTPNSIRGPATVTYSDVEGGWSGLGNLGADPRFAGGGSYRLQAGSPCLDAGSNSTVLSSTDLDGNPRIQGAAVDMGAFEGDNHEGASFPDPILVLTGKENSQLNGWQFTRYQLSVSNRHEYPEELFAPSPHLPPCGLNGDSSRTWVEIFEADGTHVYGFCGLNHPDQMDGLWFSIPRGSPTPSAVYITMEDRERGATYRSNLVDLNGRR